MQILTVLEHSPNAVQTKNLITGANYAKTKKVRGSRAVTFKGLKELASALQLLAADTSSCVVRGVLKPDAPTPLRRRRTHFDDAPQSWVMLDIDKLQLPKSLRCVPYTRDHILFATTQLPDEFQGVSCVWQASASAGKDLATLKVHLWFLLSQPLTATQLRAWLRNAPGIDPSVLRSVQPHYTAAPIGGEAVYSGERIGRVRGALKRVQVPEIDDSPEHSSETQMAPRPKSAANVSRETIAHVKATAHKRATEELNNCTVAYQTAYRIGALVGPWVALETWNDAECGHETWRQLAEGSAAHWGELVAAVPGANHGVELYSNRVMSGIVWGVARERERRSATSQLALDAALRSTEQLRQRLLRKLQANRGSERVLQEVGKELGRYVGHVDRAHLVAALQEASGFSEQQVTDALEAGASEEVPADAWREGLALTGKHGEEVVACDSNLLRIFRQYPGFMTGFRFNSRTKRLEATASNPLGLEGDVSFEALPGALVEWLASIGCAKASLNVALSCFRAAMEHFEKYDPFLELYPEALLKPKRARKELAKLEPKLDAWLIEHFGCRDKPFVRLAGAKALIAAVARAVKPGAQVDTMLVLQGEQGIGKTQVLRKLGSVIAHGYQELLDMRDKDSLISMNEGLIVEVSELRALRYSQEETSKAFFSRQRDKIRAPYARSSEDYERRIVFVGTTNDPEFLSDHQNRRYWPVTCTKVCRLTLADADALWREAALRYAVGESWWFEAEEQELQQKHAARFRYVDLIEEQLSAWLANKDEVTLVQVCSALFEGNSAGRAKDRRVAAAMRALGWGPYRASPTVRVWRRKP